MKLYTKLLVGFGSLWSVFLIATLMLIAFLHQQGSALQEAFRSNFDSVDYCSDITLTFDVMKQLITNSIWTNHPVDDPAMQSAWERYKQSADGQRQNITLPGEDKLTG